jgi:hypothetical protein
MQEIIDQTPEDTKYSHIVMVWRMCSQCLFVPRA